MIYFLSFETTSSIPSFMSHGVLRLPVIFIVAFENGFFSFFRRDGQNGSLRYSKYLEFVKAPKAVESFQVKF